MHWSHRSETSLLVIILIFCKCFATFYFIVIAVLYYSRILEQCKQFSGACYCVWYVMLWSICLEAFSSYEIFVHKTYVFDRGMQFEKKKSFWHLSCYICSAAGDLPSSLQTHWKRGINGLFLCYPAGFIHGLDSQFLNIEWFLCFSHFRKQVYAICHSRTPIQVNCIFSLQFFFFKVSWFFLHLL